MCFSCFSSTPNAHRVSSAPILPEQALETEIARISKLFADRVESLKESYSYPTEFQECATDLIVLSDISKAQLDTAEKTFLVACYALGLPGPLAPERTAPIKNRIKTVKEIISIIPETLRAFSQAIDSQKNPLKSEAVYIPPSLKQNVVKLLNGPGPYQTEPLPLKELDGGYSVIYESTFATQADALTKPGESIPVIHKRTQKLKSGELDTESLRALIREIIVYSRIAHTEIAPPLFSAVLDADNGIFSLATRKLSTDFYNAYTDKETSHSIIKFKERFYTILKHLAKLHSFGIVHGDVRASNMLIETREGREEAVYLCDFGLSGRVMHKRLGCGASYLDLDTKKRKRLKPANDVWGLGSTLFLAYFKMRLFPDGFHETKTFENQDSLSEFLRKRFEYARTVYKREDVSPPICDASHTDTDLLIDLLSQIFVIDISKRITIDSIRSHPFFKEVHEETPLPTMEDGPSASSSRARSKAPNPEMPERAEAAEESPCSPSRIMPLIPNKNPEELDSVVMSI